MNNSALRTGDAAHDVLEALALRCEREEPSDDLDKAIYVAMGFCLHEKTTYSGAQSDTGFTCDDCGADSWGNRSKNGLKQRLHDPVIAYTTSIDAAVTLVPRKCAWDVGCYITLTPGARVYGHDIHADVCASTPALALCAAALRALRALARAES